MTSRLFEPSEWVEGADIHVVFESDQAAQARALFDRFLEFIHGQEITHERALIFERPVGPWPTPMWQVLFPVAGDYPRMERELARCVMWLALNRGSLSVMVHPQTRTGEGFGGGFRDHSQYHFWMGTPQSLKLSIFKPPES